MTESAATIRQPQIAKLWAAACEVGMDSAALHALAQELIGKDSLRALTVAEASRVIDELVKRGATSGAPRRLPAGVPRLMTPWQQEHADALIRELGWQDALHLCEGVMRRAIGRPFPRTTAEAAKVIEAFKAILARRRAPQEGQR